MNRRQLLSALALLIVASTSAAAETVPMGGNDTDPSTLDQHRTSTVADGNLIRDLSGGLVTEAAGGTVIPGVAEALDVSADGLVYTFQLRNDARWSTGDPVTDALHTVKLPAVAYLGPTAAGPLTGSVVVETIFGIPGIGRWFVQGALGRDDTLAMGTVVVIAVFVIVFNLVVDLAYAWLDPRGAVRPMAVPEAPLADQPVAGRCLWQDAWLPDWASSSCSGWSAFPIPSSGSTPIRTSSRAASASG